MRYIRFIFTILLSANILQPGFFAPGPYSLSAQTLTLVNELPVQPPYFDTVNYRLVTGPVGYTLQDLKKGVSYEIPFAWVAPPVTTTAKGDVQQLTRYNPTVGAFILGGNLVGIQITSY